MLSSVDQARIIATYRVRENSGVMGFLHKGDQLMLARGPISTYYCLPQYKYRHKKDA
jgi:hypothetical protein